MKKPVEITDNEIKTKTLKFLTDANPEKLVELVNRKIKMTLKKGVYFIGDLRIEVVSQPGDVSTKKGTPGYEFYAKVWKNGQKVGFGDDGSVEIERFRNFGFNSFLVEDENGDIEKTLSGFVPSLNETISITKRYREDLQAVILQDISHTINLVGKLGTRIEIGKVGKTVDTFNPLRIASTNSGTGYFATNAGGGTFATWRALSTATYMSAINGSGDPDYVYIQMEKNGSTSYGWNVRCWGTFDTSSIPDSNTISSATISIKPLGSVFNPPSDPLTGTYLNITAFSPANKRSVVSTDMDNFSDTRFATDYAWSSLSIGTYSDLTLNASGIAYIDKTGDTSFFWRMNWDIDNSAPGATSGNTGASFDFGTTNPQKLVVTHASGGATFVPKILQS